MDHFQRLTNLRLDRKASKERTREHTRELFESIHALSKMGMKNAQVARELGIHRHTVEKYLALKTLPQRRRPAGRRGCIMGQYMHGVRVVSATKSKGEDLARRSGRGRAWVS